MCSTIKHGEERGSKRSVHKYEAGDGSGYIGHVMGIAPNRNPHVTLTWAPSGNKETRTPEGNMDENSGEGTG